MIPKKKLVKTPEYWEEVISNIIWRYKSNRSVDYMATKIVKEMQENKLLPSGKSVKKSVNKKSNGTKRRN